MNVALDPQPNCIVNLDIELPADRVAKEWNSVAKEYQKQARLPGYRPGKAPMSMVESRYGREIESEVRHSLSREAVIEAVKANKISLHAIKEIPEITIAPDKTMKIRAVVIRTPDFDLPDYKNLQLEVPRRVITDADVDQLLEYLREPRSTFDPITDRPLAMDDFAVVTYEGTVEEKPLAEFAPQAPAQLSGRRNAWLLMSEGTLVPGFAKAIEGMSIDEQRTFTLEVPATFPVAEIQGKKVTYSVTLHGINVRRMPPLDDALADKIEPGSTLESLKEKIRERQQESSDYQFDMAKRNVAVKKLLSLVTCELPEEAVAAETGSILKDIVAESQARGLSDDEIKSNTDQIVASASEGARERVRANFLLLRIAAQEKIEETEAELYQALFEMAQRQEIPIKKLAKDLSRGAGIGRLREQIRITKALDYVVSNATVTELAETQKSAPTATT
ncbi:MAG: trigger factor [Verrucomicrobiota bacterium]